MKLQHTNENGHRETWKSENFIKYRLILFDLKIKYHKFHKDETALLSYHF